MLTSLRLVIDFFYQLNKFEQLNVDTWRLKCGKRSLQTLKFRGLNICTFDMWTVLCHTIHFYYESYQYQQYNVDTRRLSCGKRETSGVEESHITQCVHTEKSFRNLIKSTRNQIVFTIFRLIWNTNKPVRLCSKSIGKW